MTEQCKNLQSDRRLGEYWEREFCKMAGKMGRSFTPHQIGRPNSATTAYWDNGRYHSATLPDVTIWTAPGEHHEIKHKDQTRNKEFGLEAYRVNALRWFAEETGQSVYYTIHDYDFAPCATRKERKWYQTNHERDWLTASIMDLVSGHYRTNSVGEISWVNGRRCEGIEMYYWPAELFVPLGLLWDFVNRPAAAPIIQTGLF